jgi:hypothetical protein
MYSSSYPVIAREQHYSHEKSSTSEEKRDFERHTNRDSRKRDTTTSMQNSYK